MPVTKGRSRAGLLLISLVVVAMSVVFGWLAIARPGNVPAAGTGSSPVIGAPEPWQLNFQAPHSPVGHGLYVFHNFLLVINIAICAFVLILIVFVIWRFRKSVHPEPSTTSHNTVLEVTWTVVPIVILLAIAVPSFGLLAEENRIPDAALTLKITGHQWFWEYNYPDNGNFQFSSLVLQDDKLPPDQKTLRLLMTDELVVLPVDTVVRLQLTSADVIHSWAVPSLGVKRDAVPGRLNEMWVKIDKEGLYFGQCSVLCGQQHSYMPIAIKAVSKEQFEAWAADARKRFASGDGGTKLASAADTLRSEPGS